MPNISNDDLAALLLHLGAPIYTSPISFRPVRPLLPISPVAPTGTPVTVVPQQSPGTGSSGVGGVPKKLLTVSAIQTPVKLQNSTVCNVTVSFTRDPSDKYYDHVNVWFVGYHKKTTTTTGGGGLLAGGSVSGSSPLVPSGWGFALGGGAPQLMASGNGSPVNFIADATLETVSVYVQAVGATGLCAPITSSAHCTVTLSGIVGPPPAPTISQTLVGTPTGYQFGFNQVILPPGDEETISNYNIFRNAANSIATATLHSTVTPANNTTGPITYIDDTTNHNSTFFYWVTAVNTAGFQSTATPAQTGPVSGSSGSIPPILSTPFVVVTTSTSVTIKTSPSCFFTRANGQTQVIGATSTTCSGLPTGNTVYFFPYWDESSQSLKFVKNTDCAIPQITGIAMTAASSQYIETTTGGSIPSSFSVEMWVASPGTAGALFDYSAPRAAGTATASVCQARVTSGGEVEFAIFNGGSWTNVTTSGASVLDSTYHHIVCTYSAGVGTVYVDGANSSDGVTFWTNASMGTIAMTSGFWHFGFVAGFSGAPLTSNTFNSFNMSFVSLYNTALPISSVSGHFQAFSNLGQTLYVQELAFDNAVNLWELNETSGTVAADSIGTNTGTYVGSPLLDQIANVVTVLGTPTIAFPYNYLLALQQQALQNHIPLTNSGLSANTGNTGTTRGGGFGGFGRGGSGSPTGLTCFTGDVLIKTNRGDIPIAEVNPGDQCFTAKGTWAPVLQRVEHEAEARMLYKLPKEGFVTFKHKILHVGKWVNAGSVYRDISMINSKVYTLTMDSDESMDEIFSPTTERSFTLTNGVVAHNVLWTKT